MRRNSTLLTAISLLMAGTILQSTPAAAQNLQPGVADRDAATHQLSIEHIQRPANLPPFPVTEEPRLEVAKPGRQVMANLDQVVFYGNTVLLQETLDKIAAPYLHKPVDEKDLAQLKYDVNKAYYDRGFVLVRAVTIPQDVTAGVLRVDVHEVKLDDIAYSDNPVLRESIVSAMLGYPQPGEVYNEHKLQEKVKNLDDLPGVRASVSLRPGSKFSTTTMVPHVEPADEDVQRITVDNYGSELTGEYIATLSLEKSNLLHLGEKYTGLFRASNDDLYTAQGGFNTPTGLGNTHLDLVATYSRNDIGDRLAALDADGDTIGLNAALQGNLKNTYANKLDWMVGLDSRRHRSYIGDTTDTRDQIRQLYGMLEHIFRNEEVLVYGAAALYKNMDILGATDNNDPMKSRFQADNEAWMFRPTVYTSYHPFAVPGEFRLFTTGQIASDVLLASDEFILGGYGSVRGIPLSEEAGDAGVVVNAEYLYPFIQKERFNLAAGPFTDWGRVWNRVPGSAADSVMWTAGLGMEMEYNYFSVGRSTLRLDYARTIGDYNSPQVDNNAFLFRAGQEF